MGYRELSPHPALRPFVDRFWVSSAESAPGPRCILPDGCIDLLIDLNRGAHATAVGTMTRATTFDPRAPVRIVAVRFRPGGAVPFLAVPADQLTDRVIACAELGLRWLAPEGLEGFADLDRAARALERSLLNRIHAIRTPDDLVAHAVTALLGPTSVSIEQLSRRLGWSRQHLRRRFMHDVGVGPKQLARVIRMHRAVDVLQRRPNSGIADTALALGYFDQAHLSRDLLDLAGVTPRVARASASSIFPIRSLLDEE
jgi:AraC-like DNA-binding protein